MSDRHNDATLFALRRLVERLEQDLKTADGGSSGFYTAMAETLLRDAQRRRELFGLDRLGDPAWNILLDLFVQGQRGTRAGTFASSVASGEPAATGLRYLRELERAGHVIRSEDPLDARRVLVRLSPGAHQAVLAHLSAFHGRLLVMGCTGKL